MDFSDCCWVLPASLDMQPLTEYHELFATQYPSSLLLPVCDKEKKWLPYGRAKFQLISFWNKAIQSSQMFRCFKLNYPALASQPDDDFFLEPLGHLFFPGNFEVATPWCPSSTTFNVGLIITTPVENWHHRVTKLLSQKDNVRVYSLEHHAHHVQPLSDARQWQYRHIPCSGNFAADVIAMSFFCQAIIVTGFIEIELANFLKGQGVMLRQIA